MKVINSNATTALFDMLEELSDRPRDSWHCVYIKPVNANDSQNAPHSASNAKAIIDQLAGIKGTAYLCEDGDIIMLFQRPAKVVVDRLSSHLGDAGQSVAKGQHTHNLFGVFHLSKHWQGLYSLCVNKYLKVIARAEERHMPIAAPAAKALPTAVPAAAGLIAAAQ